MKQVRPREEFAPRHLPVARTGSTFRLTKTSINLVKTGAYPGYPSNVLTMRTLIRQASPALEDSHGRVAALDHQSRIELGIGSNADGLPVKGNSTNCPRASSIAQSWGLALRRQNLSAIAHVR
jgi:hypothetical protein